MIEPKQQSIDLHVHSKYAGRFKLFVLNSLEVDECYTEPEDLYQRLLSRGMTMVTITDHDAIEGCLEIAHHGPHVFISEEISARFPENGCIVHVLAYGITQAQHEDIQRLRYNIYELVPYLRREGICHVLAHPFSPVNQRLTPELLQKSLLLFDNLEVINGQKDPGHERFVRRVIDNIDRNVLARWAEMHQLPIDVSIDRTWGITGGSDDHSGVTMARGFTRFEGPPTIDGLVRAVDQRRTEPVGLEKNGTSYAHTAALGTFNYFIHSHKTGRKQTYMELVDFVKSGKLPADLDDLAPAMQRIIPSALEVLAQCEQFPSAERVRADGHRPELHDEIYDLVHATLLGAFRATFAEIKKGVENKDPEPIIDELPTLLRLALFNLPYYFGFRFFNGERRRARALYDSLELTEPTEAPTKVALFCDTIDNVDGLNLGLRRIVKELRDDGNEVYLCGPALGKQGWTDSEAVVRFPTIGEIPLMGYEQYTLGLPSLVETMRWLDENEIDVVGLTTPGPVGVVGMMAARMLEIPAVGQYHTNVPEYAFRLIGDRTIGRIVKAFTTWFYSSVEQVIAPSYATRELLARDGVRSDRFRVVRRGVDSDRFHPDKRDPDFFRRYGLRGKNTLAYVGRVSVEKNLPFLVDLMTGLFARRDLELELAVVGDGPWLEEMKQLLAGYRVAFTGCLHGDELATAFASADLFVFPSTTDTFGNVVLESLSSGTPVLVSELGGPAEIARHNETGFILPAQDSHAWARAIAELVRNPEARAQMGEAGRRYAETCSFEQARRDLWNVYAQVAQRHRQRVLEDIGQGSEQHTRHLRAIRGRPSKPARLSLATPAA